MKPFVFIFAFVISCSFLFAQGNDEGQPMTRKEKRKAELEKNFQQTKKMLDNRDFVLEANYLQDRRGIRVPVASTINFVSVDSTKAVIQIGSNSRIGPNGVGGVTAKGNITKWELTENSKSKSFTLRINVMTTLGIYDLFFDINASGQSTALLTGLSAGRLSFDGNLVTHAQSSVYVGQSP